MAEQKKPAAKTAAKKPAAKKPKLVKMVLGDKTADVHPDEVENWKKTEGWREA